MSFTGFTLEQLRSISAPEGTQELLEQLDIFIDGSYVESLAINCSDSPVSSRNQRVHIFNPAFKDKVSWASDQIEDRILKDDSLIITGFRGQVLSE